MTLCTLYLSRCRRILVSAGLSGLAIFSWMPEPTDAASLYTVAKTHVDVTAKNAVEAKRLGVIEAERRAARILFKRLAPFNSGDRIPRIQVRLIEDMLEGFSVRAERNSRTRYLATLDFTFRKPVVDQLLTGYGIPIVDQQAPRLTVLPVYVAGSKVVTSGRDPWRKAWLRLDLANAVVPVKLARVAPSLTAEIVTGILQGDSNAYVKLLQQYKTRNLVLAIASIQGDGRLMVQLVGADHTGSVSYRRLDRVPGKSLTPVVRRVAHVVHGILEGRWKMSRANAGGAVDGGGLQPVSLIVEFSGLREWQAIRSRLSKVPGVQAMAVGALSARSAGVNLQFPGGVEQLSTAVGAQQLYIESQGNAWVLRGN